LANTKTTSRAGIAFDQGMRNGIGKSAPHQIEMQSVYESGRISVSCRIKGGMRKEEVPAAVAPEGF
jgi:hypothetical protein